MTRLTLQQVESALSRLPGWQLDGTRIRKEWRFSDFQEAWAFMQQVARIAQALDHHPDWSNRYNMVDITLSTHDAGGVTPLDLEMAGRIERLAPSPQ